jgi:23S rRNA pseudouridine2605 synthase
MLERLQKYLAHCGVASRRKCEEYIVDGRVKVNGETVTELGVKVDPDIDKVAVDGRKIRPEEKVYYLMHKPRGCTTTSDDELGRKAVLDLVPEIKERVYPVGRLDRDSEGLLVLTNDGQLAYYLTHPACGVKKTYSATVEGQVEDSVIEQLVEKGIRIGPVLVKPLWGKIVKRLKTNTIIEITVAEGINREVRRLFAALGHEVKKLVRLRVGPLLLKGIARGAYRAIRRQELDKLKAGMGKTTITSDDIFAFEEELKRPPRTRYFAKPVKRAGKPDPALAPERKTRDLRGKDRRAPEKSAPARPKKKITKKTAPKKGPSHPLA